MLLNLDISLISIMELYQRPGVDTISVNVYVHSSMSEANNGHHPFTAENAAIAAPALRKPKRHNAKLCSLAIRQHIVNALAAGDSHSAFAPGLA